MQQQVQTQLSAEQVLSDAASFFAKRRARVTEKTTQGFKFALPGAEDGGSLSISPAGSGGTTVTLEVEGLGVLAIAEGYVRDLRKQTKNQPRAAGGNVPLSDLRQRMGMPEPRPKQRPPTDTDAVSASDAAGSIPPPLPIPSSPAASPGISSEVGGARPDGPTPVEAASVSPETGPQGAPAPAIESGAADTHSSAEVSGGVPSADEVTTSEPPDAAPRRAGG
ncbi:MAG: hypothetical protein ACR2NO_08385 [Chloroflexota bacterium]